MAPHYLAHGKAVGHVAEAGAAIFLRDGGAQEPERAHLVHDRAVELLLAEGRDDARHELLLGVGARGIAHLAFVLGQLALEVEGVGPIEARGSGFGLLRLRFAHGSHSWLTRYVA